MRHLLYTIILLFCFTQAAFAQKDEGLPHWLTEDEALEMQEIIMQGLAPSSQKDLLTTPPAPVRTMAEWEEVEALMITWTQYPDILTEITRHAAQECRVIIVTNNP